MVWTCDRLVLGRYLRLLHCYPGPTADSIRLIVKMTVLDFSNLLQFVDTAHSLNALVDILDNERALNAHKMFVGYRVPASIFC